MTFDKDHADAFILKRLVRELESDRTIILGPGLPQLAAAHLSDDQRVVNPGNGCHGSVDAVVVEAHEISAQGDLAADGQLPFERLQAKRWIVATRHTAGDLPKIVKSCRLPVSKPACVELIISELGVIEINEVGLVLREVAPGVGADDVKQRVAASLHVADDLKLML